jgi:hypothetical protein
LTEQLVQAGGNNSHWLAKTLLEQEGEGGNFRGSGRFQGAKLLPGDGANKNTLGENVHQNRFPTVVG